VSITDEYRRQFAWRPWPRILDALPTLQGQRIVDLGCGPGDLAAEFVARGASVIGIDGDEDLIRHAQSRALAGAEFRRANLKEPLDLGAKADGLWCSFTAAYFPDLTAALASWARLLRVGGWIALTEIDDLFGHEPLGHRAQSLFDADAQDALGAKRYDFHMGRKLRQHLEQSGFEVRREFDVEDQELSFRGAARPEVVAAWRSRFDRMTLLRDFCGKEWGAVREKFLGVLARPDHESRARVRCCIGTKSG
jgi:SAM-dependent methyltransferase